MKVKSEQFLNILNKLQEQRDLEISVSEDVKDIMTEQDYLSDNKDILTDFLTEKRVCVTSLNINFTALILNISFWRNISELIMREHYSSTSSHTWLMKVKTHKSSLILCF